MYIIFVIFIVLIGSVIVRDIDDEARGVYRKRTSFKQRQPRVDRKWWQSKYPR